MRRVGGGGARGARFGGERGEMGSESEGGAREGRDRGLRSWVGRLLVVVRVVRLLSS